MPEFGVIAGSGIYDMPGLEITDSVRISTQYGDPSDLYRIGRLNGKEIAFLPRHGSAHNIPPHKINYRANIIGFKKLGVSKILSVGATGGINKRMRPGSIVILDQIIDMTSGREATFFDKDQVVHIDFTEPFCPILRRSLIEASCASEIATIDGGTYIAVNGPRLETASEIRMFGMLGADVVGMTGMPEASLAREAEICFASISVVTNAAAGISDNRLTVTEVIESMKASSEKIKMLIKAFFALSHPDKGCQCRSSLKNSKI